MKSIVKILSISLLVGLIALSCDDLNEATVYDGPAMAEFANAERTIEILKLPVKDSTAQISVQLLGAQKDESKTVGYQIIEDETNAKEGVHYEFQDDVITIPANSSFGTLPIKVFHDGFMVEESVSLTIKLVEQGLKPNPNKDKLSLTLYKKNFCPFDRSELFGTWSFTEISLARDFTYDANLEIMGTPSDTIVVKGLWYDGPVTIWGETMVDSSATKIVYDDSNPMDVKIDIPGQYLNTSTDGSSEYPYYITNSTDVASTLAGCEKTLHLYYEVHYGSPTGGLLDIVYTPIDVSGGKAEVKPQSILSEKERKALARKVEQRKN